MSMRIPLMVCVLALWLSPGQAAEKVEFPFINYASNFKYVPTGAQYGWTTDFQNGALEEGQKVAVKGTLLGEIYKPSGDGPFPFVVMFHGCGGYDEAAKKWVELWQYYLADLKIGVLAVDDFTTRGVKNICGEASIYWARRRTDDAYSALDFLATLPYVKIDKVFLMGRSSGAQTALYVNQDVYKGMRTRFYAGHIVLYANCYTRIDSNFMAPMLLFHGALDDANKVEWCESLAAKKRSPSHPELALTVYPGTYHGYDDNSPFRYYMGWRMGSNYSAAADTREKVRAFLTRQIAAN